MFTRVKAEDGVSVRSRVASLLEELCGNEELKAAGCTSAVLYLRDSVLPHYMRMVAEHGVFVRDLMHGPILPFSAAAAVLLLARKDAESEDDEWFADDRFNQLCTGRPEVEPSLLKEQSLLGGFVTRENVKSSALLRYRRNDSSGAVEAALWVNLEQSRRKFSQALKDRIRAYKRKIGRWLPQLQVELAQAIPLRLSRFAPIHRAAKSFPVAGDGNLLNEYLTTFLRTVIDSLGISSGFGSIYLLDRYGNLRKTAQLGNLPAQCQTVFSLDDCEGVISWAAIRMSPMLVDHPDKNPFYVNIDPGADPTVSQLAVPLLVGETVIGVLNLESRDAEKRFTPDDAFDLCSAARYVALCMHVSRQTASAYEDRSTRMLNIASRAAEEQNPNGIQRELENHAREWMKADRCSIWEVDDNGEFIDAQGTGAPRRGGYSDLVRSSCQAIWLQRPDDPGADAEYVFWDTELGQWQSGVPDWTPTGLNGDAVKNQLGLPVLFQGHCIAVGWFKFAGDRLPPPTITQMRLAEGLAAEIALILRMKLKHHEFDGQLTEKSRIREMQDTLFPSKELCCSGGRGYVISRPLGEIGGDFYRQIDIGEHATAFLVGDGEGHGITGACNMLPLLTAFTACTEKQQFLSPKPLLFRMDQLVDSQGTRGTAICFVIDRSREADDPDTERPRLIVCSAGHPGLLVVLNEQAAYVPPKEGQGLPIGTGYPAFYDNLLNEVSHELSVGDIIVAFTDGVLDAGQDGPMGAYGHRRLMSLVTRLQDREPEVIAKELERDVREHARHFLDDDYTIMVLKIEDLALKTEDLEESADRNSQNGAP